MDFPPFPGAVIAAAREAVKAHLFESLSAEDVEMLARVMGQVSGHLRAEPPRSAAPRKRSTN